MNSATKLAGAFVLLSSVALPCHAQEVEQCPRGRLHEETNDYYFTLSSTKGAVGDVVAIDVSLTMESPGPNIASIQIVGCFDDTKLELLEQPLYTSELDDMAPFVTFFPLGNTGFGLEAGTTDRVTALSYFSSGKAVQLATVFFRVLESAMPGTSTEVRSCSHLRREGVCDETRIYNIPGTIDISNRHRNGVVEVLEGDPTRPDPPELPPNAQVYPEAPSREEAAIHFELTGAVAQAGDRDVSVDFFATSAFEFSGYSASITFPSEYLELARVEEHTRPGIVRIDNEQGSLGMIMMNSRRRIGAEDERAKIATLYFNVKESAAEVPAVVPVFETVEPFINWLVIHHDGGGVNPDTVPESSEVAPLVLSGQALRIQVEPTTLGDVNLDYIVNITDPIALLGHLFQGHQNVVCPPAADFNEDGSVNIADPIAILQYLFVGGLHPLEADVICKL